MTKTFFRTGSRWSWTKFKTTHTVKRNDFQSWKLRLTQLIEASSRPLKSQTIHFKFILNREIPTGRLLLLWCGLGFAWVQGRSLIGLTFGRDKIKKIGRPGVHVHTKCCSKRNPLGIELPRRLSWSTVRERGNVTGPIFLEPCKIFLSLIFKQLYKSHHLVLRPQNAFWQPNAGTELSSSFGFIFLNVEVT